MSDFLLMLTKMEYTKPFVLVLFFVTFVLLIIYVYSNKKRSSRLESYKNIPFDENENGNEAPEERTGNNSEHNTK